jgi:phospholipid/cholesterol/gamma-HCH transport system substrate-binding protein
MNRRPSRLSNFWDRLRNVPGLGRNVATLVVLVALGVGASALIASQAKAVLPWSEQHVVKVEFAQVPGVTVQSTQVVRIKGVEVGRITGTEVTPRGTAVLSLTIEGHHTIYDNAHAVLRAVNPLNQMYVEIDPGGTPGKPLTESAVLPVSQTSRPIQPDEVLQKLDEKSQAALTDLLAQSDVALASAPTDLPAGLRATDQGLTDLRPVVEMLQTRRDKIAQLVTSLGQIASAVGGDQQRATRLADAVETSLGVLAQHDGELRATFAQLPGLSDAAREALTKTRDLTQQLNPTLDNLERVRDDLPDTLDRATRTVDHLGDFVNAARPVVSQARPLVRDLRPTIRDLNDGLSDVVPLTKDLDKDTKMVVDYLTELRAFTYQTTETFSLQDGRGGIVRGEAVIPLPDGGALPGAPGYVPTPEESGVPMNPGSRTGGK